MRIKDPKRSIDFYTNILNFKLISVKKFPEWKFDLYFLSLNHSLDEKDIFNTNGILELTLIMEPNQYLIMKSIMVMMSLKVEVLVTFV